MTPNTSTYHSIQIRDTYPYNYYTYAAFPTRFCDRNKNFDSKNIQISDTTRQNLESQAVLTLRNKVTKGTKSFEGSVNKPTNVAVRIFIRLLS